MESGVTPKQIVCMKWGELYGAHYVNRLYAMARRHLAGPIRVVCLTDDRAGIREEVECFDCPSIDAKPPHDLRGWRKLVLWAPEVADLAGEVLFLDLDLVIVDDINPLFEYPGEFCVMRNWTQPRLEVGNTSVFRFRVGARTDIFEKFCADPDRAIASIDNEQMYVCREHGNPTFWPDAWCKSFKVHCVPAFPLNWLVTPAIPPGTRIVVFHGAPNPDDAMVGRWPVKRERPLGRIYKHIRPVPWVGEHWRDGP